MFDCFLKKKLNGQFIIVNLDVWMCGFVSSKISLSVLEIGCVPVRVSTSHSTSHAQETLASVNSR